MKLALVSFFFSLTCLSSAAQDSLPVFAAGTIYSYGEDVSLYPEGFVLTRGQKLMINGEKEILNPEFK